MRKTIKRVCLIEVSTGAKMDFAQDFIGTLPDEAILGMFHERYKNVWIGKDLYKVVRDYNGSINYFKYEVYKVVRKG